MKYDSVKLEIYTTGAWMDISDYVSRDHPISWNRGIMGNGITDRIARPGNISFTLYDTTGQFDPINSSAVLGSGTPVRFVVSYEEISRILWYGKISNVAPREDDLYKVFSQVTGLCQLENYNRPLVTPSITTNKTASEVVDEINEDLSLVLTDTQKQYGTMTNIFPSVFDTSRSKQNALGEISKAVMSELGYFAIRGTRLDADNYVLTIDGRNTREGRSYITIPVGKSLSGFLLKEDGGYLLKEDGGKIILDKAETFDEFDLIAEKLLAYGKNITNECAVTVYPRDYSATPEVLFSLTSTPGIEPTETLEMLSKYKDPTQQAQSITARTMLLPAPNVDYAANAASDGTGADMTSDLSVTAVYGAAEINYTLVNNNTTTKLYVTKLQARGEGIFFYGTVALEAEDTASQAVYGNRKNTLDLKYIDDVSIGQNVASAIVASTKTVFPEVDWIEVLANTSSKNLYACMFLDIGDPLKITLKDASGNMTARKFYINGINWSGTPGAWKVRYTVAAQEVVEL